MCLIDTGSGLFASVSGELGILAMHLLLKITFWKTKPIQNKLLYLTCGRRGLSHNVSALGAELAAYICTSQIKNGFRLLGTQKAKGTTSHRLMELNSLNLTNRKAAPRLQCPERPKSSCGHCPRVRAEESVCQGLCPGPCPGRAWLPARAQLYW